MPEIDPKLAEQLRKAEPSAEEAFEKIARGKKKKKSEQQWGDDFIEEFNLSVAKLRTRIPLKNLVFFTRQLATMFAAGLTLEKSLSNLAAEEKHTGFKKTLESVAEDIRRGLSLSASMDKHPGTFDNLFIALVKAGEVSGSLQTILDQLATYIEAVHDTNQKVKSALYYPFMVLGFLVFVMAIMLIWIVPRFAEVYNSLGADLPGPTLVLLRVSDAFVNHFAQVIFFIIVGWIAVWMIGLTRRGGYIIDSMKLKFPVFGRLITYNIYNKMTKTLGILLGAGVPVLPSMKLIQRVVNNKVYSKAIGTAAEYVRDGYNISAAFRISEKFPSIMLQLISTGEETGELDNLLDKAADFYAKQVESMVSRMTSLIEPLMIMFVGGLITLVLFVTYLPVFYIGQAMKTGM
ncbi:MAG: type II secretion system F family protein [Candidatus Marinimicrobia bacterium]|nr:type II secretion system F family protein [Candidatus Neomarinimicrobiota bacterium]